MNPSVPRRKSGPKPRPIRQRILESIEVDTNGCWRWQKYVSENGYGHIGVPGTTPKWVHRVAYEAWIGPIPDGLHIDHLCRVRDCCNPEHLEPVTPRENVLRGTGFAAEHAKRTHCPKGHPYDEENTYVRPGRGGRDCNTCRSMASRAKAKRLKGKLSAVPIKERPVPTRFHKTHCKAGHPYSGENLYIDTRGGRQCRECRRAAVRRSRAKRRPGGSSAPPTKS